MVMTVSDHYEIPVHNATPPDAQAKLYDFVRELDAEYNFPAGLDIYYHLLSALNQYFKKL